MTCFLFPTRLTDRLPSFFPQDDWQIAFFFPSGWLTNCLLFPSGWLTNCLLFSFRMTDKLMPSSRLQVSQHQPSIILVNSWFMKVLQVPWNGLLIQTVLSHHCTKLGSMGTGGGVPCGVTTNSRTKLSTEKRFWWLLSSEPWKPGRLDPQWLLFGLEDVSLVEFMHLVFTDMPGKSYGKQFRSLLLYSCDVFQVLTKSLHFLILDCRLSWIGESSTFLFSLADNMIAWPSSPNSKAMCMLSHLVLKTMWLNYQTDYFCSYYFMTVEPSTS